VTERANQKADQFEHFEEKSTTLTVQVLWACYAWNVTPEEAARQVVADLYAHLAGGGTVPVHVEGFDGTELEVSAGVVRAVELE
jgi:hypothetical protein